MATVTHNKAGLFQRMNKFIREAWLELRKTSWPDATELRTYTLQVLVAVIIVAIWIGGLDYLLSIITKRVIGW